MHPKVKKKKNSTLIWAMDRDLPPICLWITGKLPKAPEKMTYLYNYLFIYLNIMII